MGAAVESNASSDGVLSPERVLGGFAMMERGLEDVPDGGPIDCDVGGRLREPTVRRVAMLVSLRNTTTNQCEVGRPGGATATSERKKCKDTGSDLIERTTSTSLRGCHVTAFRPRELPLWRTLLPDQVQAYSCSHTFIALGVDHGQTEEVLSQTHWTEEEDPTWYVLIYWPHVLSNVPRHSHRHYLYLSLLPP